MVIQDMVQLKVYMLVLACEIGEQIGLYGASSH